MKLHFPIPGLSDMLVLLLISCASFPSISGWGSSKDKIKLADLQTITLTHGLYTNGRRSAGVPQLKCVGGTAGCSAFVPESVQCYNKGFDGYDVQWECKTDMPNEYKFGKIEVTCEGFDFPEDPYVLKGSCGLEYTINQVGSGQRTQNTYQDYSYQSRQNVEEKSTSGFATILAYIAFAIVVYAIYVTCIAPTDRTNARSRTNDDFHGRPPPPGFRSDYYPSGGTGPAGDSYGFTGDSCNRGATSGAGTSTGTSFTTGLATGGLLGYMFGRNQNTGTGYYGAGPSTIYRAPTQNSWGGFGGGGSSSSTSSGSRTASGFGGTKRR